MTLREQLGVDKIIKDLANEEGLSPADVRQSMQDCIDAAWSNKTSDSSEIWLKFFPDGQKPSVEKFIVTLGKELRNRVPKAPN